MPDTTSLNLLTSNLFKNILVIIVLWALIGVANRAITKAMDKIMHEHRIEANKRTIYYLVAKIIRYVLYIMWVAFILDVFGFSTAPLLAVGSAAGVALGLGAQQVVRDIISGFLLLSENKFVIGESVTIQGFVGTVEDMSLLTTRLRDPDTGDIFSIPNGEIKIITNHSRKKD